MPVPCSACCAALGAVLVLLADAGVCGPNSQHACCPPNQTHPCTSLACRGGSQGGVGSGGHGRLRGERQHAHRNHSRRQSGCVAAKRPQMAGLYMWCTRLGPPLPTSVTASHNNCLTRAALCWVTQVSSNSRVLAERVYHQSQARANMGGRRAAGWGVAQTCGALTW